MTPRERRILHEILTWCEAAQNELTPESIKLRNVIDLFVDDMNLLIPPDLCLCTDPHPEYTCGGE